MKLNKRARRDAARLYRACLVNGVLDSGRALQVVDAVAGTGRRAVLPVLACFARLVRLDRDRHRVSVHSAVALPADLRAQVETGIGRAYGPGLTLTFEEDAALLGGMRVQVGSDVWDGTVLGALRALEERL